MYRPASLMYQPTSRIEELQKLYADVLVFKRGEDIPLNKEFYLKDFTCNCGNCREQLVSQKLLHLLTNLSKLLDKPIVIVSGYRCNRYNDLVSEELDSLHTKGLAVDIQVSGLKTNHLAELAREAGFCGGFGHHKQYLHLDLGVSRAWQY